MPENSKRRMRLLFINRSYWPDSEATGQLLTELCEDLVGRFDVTVLAGQPNHVAANDTFCASGREIRHGVQIERVRHPNWGKRSMAARAVNLLGFFMAAMLRAFRLQRHDVVVVETDPFLLPLLAAKLKWWHKCRMVVYLQDLYPDVAVALGKVKEGFITRFLRARLKAAYKRADLIIVLSGDMKKRLVNWGIEQSKIECLENWIDTSLVVPVKENNAFRVREQITERFVVMHSGNMGLSQNLINVVEAASLIQDSPGIEVLFVGAGADRTNLMTRSQELRLKNLRFLPYQPKDQLAQSLSAADMHLISIHEEAHHCLMPSKLYGILASGSPVLVVAAADSELASLVRQHEIGFVVPPRDPRALANQILWCSNNKEVLQEMGKRARQLCVDRYDRELLTSRFGELINTTCSI